MSVLFCSDLHISHALAAEKRGFASVEEHDRNIIDTLAAQCHKKDILWILGDVCFDLPKMEWLNEIRCRKILVRGNHDQFDTSVYLKYFEEIYGIIKYKNFWITHCPIHPQEMFRCDLNVHGHLHKNTKSPPLPHPFFNVNWDYWGRAVTLDEIKAFRDKHLQQT